MLTNLPGNEVFTVDIVANKNVRRLWDDLARMHGHKTALLFEDIAGKSSQFSYAELNGEINRAANVFLEMGIEKGDRVAVHLNNSPEFLFCWFGLAKIGAIVVPVNVHYREGECAYIFDKCTPKALVLEEQFLPLYSGTECECRVDVETMLVARIDEARDIEGTINFTRAMAEQPAELKQEVSLDPSDAAEILFTSGTTSKPKGVVITHYNLVFAGAFSSWQTALRSDDRYLIVMPAFHIDFQCTVAMPTFYVGATLVMMEKYSARKFWKQVCCYRATLTELIPLMVRTLMMQPEQVWERNHCLREVLFYLTLSDAEKDAFLKRFDVRFLTSYGMTETIVGILGDCPGDERRWPSIGRPGLCYEARIVEEDMSEVGPNTIGEIVLKGVPGKTIFKEYYNDPEATAKALDGQGWLRTGDKGYMDEDGYFYFVDRKLNLIKRSGENIASTEIEKFLVTHPKIVDAAVVGVPDKICDEAVVAYVVPQEGETVTAEEIFEFCTANIAKFKVPSCIEVRSSFPRTSTGKVKKHVLREESIAATNRLN